MSLLFLFIAGFVIGLGAVTVIDLHSMKIQEIRKIAKDRGLNVNSRLNKTELIRSIQRAEGNADCFGTKYVNI